MASVKKSNVPDSWPGPNSVIGSSGHPARSSLHFVIFCVAAGSHNAFSSRTVMASAQVLDGLMITVRPS